MTTDREMIEKAVDFIADKFNGCVEMQVDPVAIYNAIKAQDADKWMPINTAPKDGTRVLGCNGQQVEVIFYADGLGWFNQSSDYSIWGAFPPEKWQPLPSPPRIKNDGEV